MLQCSQNLQESKRKISLQNNSLFDRAIENAKYDEYTSDEDEDYNSPSVFADDWNKYHYRPSTMTLPNLIFPDTMTQKTRDKFAKDPRQYYYYKKVTMLWLVERGMVQRHFGGRSVFYPYSWCPGCHRVAPYMYGCSSCADENGIAKTTGSLIFQHGPREGDAPHGNYLVNPWMAAKLAKVNNYEPVDDF